MATQSHLVRPLINMVSGGESSGYGMLTVRENLWMFGQFYGLDNRTTRRRTDELLDVVGLKDRADTKSSDLSTGLRQKIIAPIHVPSYLFGRAMARFLTGTMAVAITIVVGVLFLNVPINLLHANWAMFIAAMLLGVISLGSMGIILGSLTLTVRSEAWFLGEATAGALHLFSGAVFPVTLLPDYLQAIAFILPMSYWLELVRRALLGPTVVGFPTLAAFGNTELFAILASLTVAFTVVALLAFRCFDRVAREKGLIDVQSNF